MATIPMGNAGRALPGRVPLGQGVPVGLAAGRALERAGAEGVQAGLQIQADQTRLDAQQLATERQRQDAEAAGAARATASFELGSAELRLKTRAEELASQILEGGVSEKDARERFSEASVDILNEHAGRVAPGLREHVSSTLRLKVAEIPEVVIRPAAKLRTREETKANVLGALANFEREASTDRPLAVARAGALLESSGSAAGLGPDDQQRLLQGFREKTAYRSAELLVKTSPETLPELDRLATRIGSDEFADLSAEGRQRLDLMMVTRRSRLEHARMVAEQRAAAAAERRAREAEDSAKSLQMLVDGGALPDDAMLAEVQRKTAGTPWAPAVRSLLVQGAERAGFASLSPQEQQQTLLDLRARANQQGSNPAQEKRLNRLEEIAKDNAKKAEADPLRWAVESRLLPEVAPLKFARLDDVLGQLATRVDQAKTVSARLGRNVSPLMKDEADRVAQMMSRLSEDEKGGYIAGIAGLIGWRQTQALAKQISGSDRALSLAFAVGAEHFTEKKSFVESVFAAGNWTPPTNPVATMILRGDRVLKESKERLGDKGDIATQEVRRKIYTYIGDALRGQARDDIADAALLIKYGRTGLESTNGVEEATHIALGGRVVEHNGGSVVLPTAVRPHELAQKLNVYPRADIDRQARDGFVYMVGGRPMGVPEFLAALPGAKLETVGKGRYTVRSGGGLVMNAERHPIVIDLDPLR